MRESNISRSNNPTGAGLGFGIMIFPEAVASIFSPSGTIGEGEGVLQASELDSESWMFRWGVHRSKAHSRVFLDRT